MLNVNVIKDTLTITIEVSRDTIKQAQPSKTGKTRLIASTHGMLPIETPHGVVLLALNLMTK